MSIQVAMLSGCVNCWHGICGGMLIYEIHSSVDFGTLFCFPNVIEVFDTRVYVMLYFNVRTVGGWMVISEPAQGKWITKVAIVSNNRWSHSGFDVGTDTTRAECRHVQRSMHILNESSNIYSHNAVLSKMDLFTRQKIIIWSFINDRKPKTQI